MYESVDSLPVKIRRLLQTNLVNLVAMLGKSSFASSNIVTLRTWEGLRCVLNMSHSSILQDGLKLSSKASLAG